MDAKRILNFLRQVMANNNRPWFQEHKAEYDAARAEFEQGIAQALERIFERPVTRCVLWFLHPGLEHEIPLENQGKIL